MNKISSKLQSAWGRLKKIKHIEIYITVIFAIIIIAIYLSSMGAGSKKKVENNTETNINITTSAEYVDYLENKLDNVLSSVKGASNVKTIITLECGFEYVYATEEETKTTSQGTITITKVITVNGQPVIVKEISPKVKGVVVVAKGAEDVSVKMNMLTLIQTVLEVKNANISILAGN